MLICFLNDFLNDSSQRELSLTRIMFGILARHVGVAARPCERSEVLAHLLPMLLERGVVLDQREVQRDAEAGGREQEEVHREVDEEDGIIRCF